MLPLLPIVLLLLVSFIVLGMHILKLKFRQYWLISTIVALLAWSAVLISKLFIPSSLYLMSWEPIELFPNSPLLVADTTAWMFTAAMVTVVLSTLLVEATRKSSQAAEKNIFYKRLGLMLLTSVSLLAVYSGNLLTLISFWVILDITDILITLRISTDGLDTEQLRYSLFTRLLSILILIFAVVISISNNYLPGFSGLPRSQVLLILVGASLRMVLLPLFYPIKKSDQPDRFYSGILQLVPLTASLVVLVRLTYTSGSIDLNPLIYFILAAAGILCGWLWLTRENVNEALKFWIICMSILVVASSILGRQSASLTWSITTLMCGALLILFMTQARWARYILYFGLLNLSALPFFASWGGIELYANPVPSPVYIFLILQGILLSGYFRFIKIQRPGKLGGERWMTRVYPFGLLFIPVIQNLTIYYGDPSYIFHSFSVPADPGAYWPGLAASSIGVVFWHIQKRFKRRHYSKGLSLRPDSAINWLKRIIVTIYRAVEGLVIFGNEIFEGRGGIFWSLLLLLLVVALIIQF